MANQNEIDAQRFTVMQNEWPVCDNCLDAANDLGAEDKEMQEILCREIGSELIDHSCITVEEPELGETCECLCSRNKPDVPDLNIHGFFEDA